MIDEKKLIPYIKGWYSEMEWVEESAREQVNEALQEMKESILRIIDEQPKADWIPYTTNGELPYNGQKVWLSFSNELYSYVKQAWWIYDHFEWNNGKTVKDYPIAWQPFIVPQPYKKEGAE